MSKGEALVAKLLKQAGILFEREVSFADCKGYKGTTLRFDFLIEHPLMGPTLLEWHGQHHYEYTKHFHKNRGNFSYRRQLDTVKCSYALAHQIPMFVVPFCDYEELKTANDLFKESYRVRERQHAIIHNPLKEGYKG